MRRRPRTAAAVAAHSCRTGLAASCCSLPLFFFHHSTHRRPWKASCGCCFFLIHDASPAQVRDKTESSRRPFSFLPNSKSSRALNHQQSDKQGAPVRQPWKFLMKLSLWCHNFSFFRVKIKNYWRWFFFPPRTYFESWQTREYFLETLGDAQQVSGKNNLQNGSLTDLGRVWYSLDTTCFCASVHEKGEALII